jgi:hypothetical protein
MRGRTEKQTCGRAYHYIAYPDFTCQLPATHTVHINTESLNHSILVTASHRFAKVLVWLNQEVFAAIEFAPLTIKRRQHSIRNQ